MRYNLDAVIDRYNVYAMKWKLSKPAPMAAAFGMDLICGQFSQEVSEL